MAFALICPDENLPAFLPVIVGMHVLRKFREDCEEKAGLNFGKKLQIGSVWVDDIYAIQKTTVTVFRRILNK